jgi:hypothetical protein
MKKGILYITLSFAAILSLTTCKNDLEVLAPGEESVSVYGILNPNAAVQNIRINKVYLTDGDAITAGQDNSTINYGPGELQVSLERYLDGVQMNVNSLNGTISSSSPLTDKRITLTETIVTSASGNFNQNQRIWQTNQKILVTPPTPTATKQNKTEYKLFIKILSSGKEITSQTVVCDSIKSYSTKPFIHHPTLYPSHGSYIITGSNPTPTTGYIDYSTLTATQTIKFLPIANVKLYNIVMRFHYIDSLIGGGTKSDSVDYNFPNQTFYKETAILPTDYMQVSFTANDFYINLATEISKKSTTGIKNRRSLYMEYIINVGAGSLYNFLEVNAPSNSIAQDKPNYTNINGGIGIFSCKSRSTITHDLLNDFINKIACHPSTNPYGFCNSLGIKTGVCP